MQQKTNEHLHTSTGANDECYTYSYAVEPLLNYLEPFRNKIIWCPFDRFDDEIQSEFVRVFSKNGFEVVNSHIDYGQDFYTYEPDKWDILISNPPFSNKTQMFKRAISFGKPFALLMNITYLNDATAAKTFKDIDLQILSFDDRMEFKNRNPKKQINFLSAYFCRDFLPKQFQFGTFKNQLKLFEANKLIADPTSELCEQIKSTERQKDIIRIKKELYK